MTLVAVRVAVKMEGNQVDDVQFLWTVSLLALFWGLVAGGLGNRVNKSGTYFLVGFFLGPIGLLIVLVVRPSDVEKHERVGKTECGACFSLIDQRASICPHCGTKSPSVSAEAVGKSNSCRNCFSPVNPRDESCPRCGVSFLVNE